MRLLVFVAGLLLGWVSLVVARAWWSVRQYQRADRWIVRMDDERQVRDRVWS